MIGNAGGQAALEPLRFARQMTHTSDAARSWSQKSIRARNDGTKLVVGFG